MLVTTTYRNRRAVSVENRHVRVTVLEGGGHIAEILDKDSGVNPLWSPIWPSIEPAAFGPSHYAVFGREADGPLLASIMGHSLCLDIFGGPSDEEARTGLTAHGEAPVVAYSIEAEGDALVMRADLPLAQLRLERRIVLLERAVSIRETVENLSACDRPVGWTQHVTLGPPFLARGTTEFRTSATQSRVFESRFGDHDYLAAAADFDWPFAPGIDGSTIDRRVFTAAPHSSAYTAHLLDPNQEDGFFVAYSPESRLAFGYVWKRRDFPWLVIWEESASRTASPWNGASLTCGMEFGVSPFPESRRQMIDRGRLFGTPTYRWLPARSAVTVEYWVLSQCADAVPEMLAWPE